jgi:hypothetical protein
MKPEISPKMTAMVEGMKKLGAPPFLIEAMKRCYMLGYSEGVGDIADHAMAIATDAAERLQAENARMEREP